MKRLPLLWRVFAINATLLVLATLLLAVTPVTIHAPIALVEALTLFVGLTVMLAANLLLLRRMLRPIERLAQRMSTVDLLRPGQRLAEAGGVEATALTRAFNQMLARLERERQESGRRALEAQETERQRIASGLHDEVGQVLTGVLLQLDAVAGASEPERRQAVAETKEAVRQALDEVRRIARELRPEMLETLGLVSALTELTRRFADQTRIAVDRRFAEHLPPLSPDVELALYRVASRVGVSLEAGSGSVVLRVADDGRGIDPSVTENGYGGLRGMRERALLVGGALAIKSGPSGGVEVRLEVPAGPG